MKSKSLKKFTIHLATVAAIGALASPVMAATAVEYGLLSQLISQLGTIPTATQHNECNQQTPKKSPVNNKSLNPVCNICIGGTDEIAGEYAVLVAGDSSVNLLCLNSTIGAGADQAVPFPAQKLTDLQSMCDSRGGTHSDFLNLGLITVCSFPAP